MVNSFRASKNCESSVLVIIDNAGVIASRTTQSQKTSQHPTSSALFGKKEKEFELSHYINCLLKVTEKTENAKMPNRIVNSVDNICVFKKKSVRPNGGEKRR